ncbi:MAG: M1 family metallopeptidase [Bacteroidia bacterium]|nr:M1 family metallopeptidase [Bacteroidia bacterium]
MKKIYFFSLWMLSSILAGAQNLDYFQQDVTYQIEVQLDDKKHTLAGFETIRYTNNSPNALEFIWFHIWPNAYANSKTALSKQEVENGDTYLHFLKGKGLGSMDGIAFQVDGKPASWEYHPEHKDICKVLLNTPLLPKQSITLTIPFHVQIPDGQISRLGHVGQAYFITQWYPKPAVYDHKGWHAFPYLNQGEFYSEFGTYDVKITLPGNYVVGATGDLVDGAAELDWLNKKAEATAAKTNFDTRDMDFPESEKETKTLHYHQEKVHDFAWFADKRWNVLKSEVELPNKQKVTTWAYFTNQNASTWKKAPQYINDATWFYSQHCGNYPYKHVTAVDGTIAAGGGMEYPNITVIGNAGSDYSLETVIMHEVGHNWFYGILGSNEREFGWMDEGLNSFFESRYNEWKHPKANFFDLIAGESKAIKVLGKFIGADKQAQNYYYEMSYLFEGRRGEDQPIQTHSADFTMLNYGAIMYSKTADVFNYLLDNLGEDLTDKIFRTYFDRWKFRHPYPEDFRKVAEEVAQRDLSWLFNDLIQTNKRMDYKIRKVKADSDKLHFQVVNLGQTDGPISVSAIKDGKEVKKEWFNGFQGKKDFTLNLNPAEADKLVLDYDRRTVDLYRKNNQSRVKGAFKTWEKLQFKFVGGLEDPTRNQIFWTPIVGANLYNKFMLGLAFYNALLPNRRFEYIVAPMYGFGNKNLAGHAEFFYNMYPRLTFFQKISLGIEGSRYAWNGNNGGLNYNVLIPSVSWTIKKTSPRSHFQQSTSFRTIFVSKENFVYGNEVSRFSNYYVNEFTHRFVNDRKINPFSIVLNVQQSTGMAKASITANYSKTFKGKNKSFDIRLFYGKVFVYDYAKVKADFRYRLSGLAGYQDYQYSQPFIGRFENPNQSFWGNQFIDGDGGFKVFSPYGQTGNWLLAANFKTSIHRVIPFKLFVDIGTYAMAKNAFPESRSFVFDYGVSLPILKNVLEIYYPIGYSKDIDYYMSLNGIKWYQRFRFSLNLKNINPIKMARGLSF